MKETDKHRMAFEYYLALGPDRNLVKVQQKYSVCNKTVANWSKAFNWQKKLAQRTAKHDVAAAKNNDVELINRKSMQLKVVAQAFKSYVHQLIGEMPVQCPECSHSFTLRVPGIKAQFRDVDMLVRLQEFLAGEADSHTKHSLTVTHVYKTAAECPHEVIEGEVVDANNG